MTGFRSVSRSRALLSLLVAVAVLSVPTSHGLPGSSSGGMVKVWRENTNFGNARNWEGLVDGNCSGNIFSFPGWMDPAVVAFPSTFIGKQIILPVNGHFVFQPGLTTLSDSGTCQHGREVKFRRTSRADWFDPQNWITSDRSTQSGGINRAVPQVERVPCQYDSVKFPSRTTFNLVISQNIAISKFFVGEEEKSYTDMAILMTSEIGKLQFQKRPEVLIKLTNSTCTDSDEKCICDNYKAPIRTKICSLSQCKEEECHNPILPHGFCCPICGFHIRIRHNGELRLVEVEQKLQQMINSAKVPKNGVQFYVSRYQVKGAHVIILADKNQTAEAIRISRGIVKYLKNEPQVGDVTWNGSWEDVPTDADKWATEGLNGGIITLIVILILSLLIGIACFLFNVYYKGTYPSSFTFENLRPNFRMPTLPSMNMGSMQMPNFAFPGRRGSTQAGGRTFGFARFSNDRVSTVNIERRAGNLERGEEVDETINPIETGVTLETVTDASTDFGFANVTYDIVGATDSSSTADLINNPFEPELKQLETKEEKIVDLDETPKPETAGPAKPTRTKAVKNEPIYDEVVEVCDDTSPILLPEFSPRESTEE